MSERDGCRTIEIDDAEPPPVTVSRLRGFERNRPNISGTVNGIIHHHHHHHHPRRSRRIGRRKIEGALVDVPPSPDSVAHPETGLMSDGVHHAIY
ncbi:hypothetical protein QE152_g9032 [Popillia japonica]|uniref:Uncharacterized protein n=1 Tax=Popillia japonica TaxID=7064 RepID=A0AAW1M0D3_POPJA